MPVPQHSDAVASVQVAGQPDGSGITELRVHGVGGRPPATILDDLSPEQVSGDGIAGFYRTSDRHAASSRHATGSRHVECYSWSGLTSRSRTRVLWLALLPFLLGNLAGWMCSAQTRRSGRRFALHRAAHGLGALALTGNATLIAAMIGTDLLGYQAPRANLARHQWWLAPLTWHFITGHAARQATIGTAAVLLLLVALHLIGQRSWRYEQVRPPYRGETPPPVRAVTAAALPDGLADKEFWDGETSVRQFTWLHLAAAVALLTIVLGVTARKVSGAGGVGALFWIAIVLAAAVLAGVVGWICLDAAGRLPEVLLRRLPGWLLIAAGITLAMAGLYAWFRTGFPASAIVLHPSAQELAQAQAACARAETAAPAGSHVACAAMFLNVSAGLPGMGGLIGWTALGIALVAGLALISGLLGIGPDWKRSVPGGAWVTLMLAFSVLNVVLLGVLIWVAHIVGPVTGDVGSADGKLYLPALVTGGVPVLGWTAAVVAIGFAVVEVVLWLRSSTVPGPVLEDYQRRAAAYIDGQPRERRAWYQVATAAWQRGAARGLRVGAATHDAAWLLWAIVIAQLAVILATWLLHWQPPAVVRYAGTAVAAFFLPMLMTALFAAWSDPARRRQIAILWDVGTFWPRSYHPLAPPCYSERAIPELQRRMWWLHDNGGRVVLVGHSQGSVLSVAALAQPECRPPEPDHALLVTFGCPVRKLYEWAFPGYFGAELLQPLAASWRNVNYPTDPIGGPVEPVGVGEDPHGGPVGNETVDMTLPDPADCWFVYGQNPPGPQGHSGYWSDARVWTVIDAITESGRTG